MCPTSEKSFLGTLTSNVPTSEDNVYREIKGIGKGKFALEQAKKGQRASRGVALLLL
jgi:hypothetical protein